MDYCGPQGLPRSEFLRWARDDRDAALLWVVRQRQVCAGCGTRPEDWDPELGGHPRAFVATLHRCPGCAATENRRKRAEKDREKGELAAGMHVVLRRQNTQEARP